LISRFVDSEAEFYFVPGSEVMARAQELGAIPFDAGGKAQPLDHHDGRCTFEAILERYELNSPALQLLATVVHGADIANAPEKHALSDGLEAVAVGYSMLFPDDHENLAHQFVLYDALYAWCRLQTKSAR
jgi:hypothetical protein